MSIMAGEHWKEYEKSICVKLLQMLHLFFLFCRRFLLFGRHTKLGTDHHVHIGQRIFLIDSSHFGN